MREHFRSVRGRLVVGAAAFFAAFTIAIALLVNAQRAVLDASHDATRTTRVLATSASLEKAVVDMETGQRGLALTGEERFLQPWIEGRKSVKRLGRDLQQQVRGQLGEQRVRELRDSIDAYVREYSAPFVARVRVGATRRWLRETMPMGKARMDEIRSEFESFRAVRIERVERDEAAADRLSHRSRALAFTIWGVLAIMLAILVYLFTRTVVRPIARVRDGVELVASGKLDARVDGGALPETIALVTVQVG